jgi:hypothetical protein
MTRTVRERSGLPGNAENGWPPEPAGFLTAYPGYRSTALLDRLRATEFSSAGLASNAEDVERFVSFAEMTYRDRVVDTGGLAPRRGC